VWTTRAVFLSTLHVSRNPSGTVGIPSPRLIAAARTLAGLTQEQLATEAGVHRTMISRYEAGTNLMRIDKLEQVIQALRKHGIRIVGPTAETAMGLTVDRGKEVLLVSSDTIPRED
jgi:transcriptional regulator with XRE-family HTH domain